ncbi:MAG: Gfo/Idh/MocA family oxidoreductase [Candidatus Bathyarchaeota archaeon]|jgi:predicted dehydrogenase|nr:Gfo/Idh/MocA family oxidoreductase [Candidatus Bathyarchaeota archaeon]
MLRLGIIGCGRVTTMFHLNAIKASGVVDLVSISDKSGEQLAEVKGATRVDHAYGDYHELLARSEVEAVSINTPPRFHEEMTLEAIKAGKHVLCEKPLTQTVEGCIKIREAKKDLVVLPAHNYVYTPAIYRMEEKIRQRAIGEVRRVKLNFENNLGMYGSKTDFRTRDPRGIIEDVMPHILSVAGIIAGKPERVVEVSGICKKYEVCDNLHVTVETERGVALDCTASWTRTIPTFAVVVEGEKGRLKSDFAINPYSYTLEAEGNKTKTSERGPGWYLDLLQFKHPSFSEQYRHFDSLIHGGGEPRITIDDEIAMLKVIQEIGDKLVTK